MLIRKYVKEDLDGLIRHWTESFPDDPPHNEPAKMIQAKLLVDDLIFVAEDDGRILGACMAGYDGHRGWINYLAVDPDFQRSGFGRTIMMHAEQLLHDFGCPKINLQIRRDNINAVAFYESLGFTEDAVVSYGKRLIPDG